MHPKDPDGMAHTADLDREQSDLGLHFLPHEAVWSGSTLFAQAQLSENIELIQYDLPLLFFLYSTYSAVSLSAVITVIFILPSGHGTVTQTIQVLERNKVL